MCKPNQTDRNGDTRLSLKIRPPFQLSNNGSHAEKKFSELNRASATTSRIDCWQKRLAEEVGSASATETARLDTDGRTRVDLVAVRESDMNKETDSQRCAEIPHLRKPVPVGFAIPLGSWRPVPYPLEVCRAS